LRDMEFLLMSSVAGGGNEAPAYQQTPCTSHATEIVGQRSFMPRTARKQGSSASVMIGPPCQTQAGSGHSYRLGGVKSGRGNPFPERRDCEHHHNTTVAAVN